MISETAIQNEITYFTDEFLLALSNWQRGWNENQEKRKKLASQLKKHSEKLPNKFKTVEEICYRTRFLHKEELEEILVNEKEEGIVSWTTNLEVAKKFKRTNTNDSSSIQTIFEHNHPDSELSNFSVIINIPLLWKSKEFLESIESYRERKELEAKALLNFRDFQAEIVLESSLRYREIIHLLGKSHDFDYLFDKTNISEEDRETVSKWISGKGVNPGEPSYLSRKGTKNVVSSMRDKVVVDIALNL